MWQPDQVTVVCTTSAATPRLLLGPAHLAAISRTLCAVHFVIKSQEPFFRHLRAALELQ